MQYSIKIQGMDELQKKLKSLENFQKVLNPPMEKAVNVLVDTISEYKQKKKGAFTQYATTGQKRAYWAKVRKGLAEHREGIGYVRTLTMGRKWTRNVHNIPGGVRGEIGNNAPGAKWVHGSETQQKFHQVAGWETDKTAWRKNENKIRGIFNTAIQRELNK